MKDAPLGLVRVCQSYVQGLASLGRRVPHALQGHMPWCPEQVFMVTSRQLMRGDRISFLSGVVAGTQERPGQGGAGPANGGSVRWDWGIPGRAG